ncbi:hypothetical protein AB833_16595 [Chromatiales bacterium (ex Bugula neritina AB1)]|nr:hypothetical protein AB833_16595 [Chromatiales bacterium (ex Bugula neritina AB1)]
MLKSHTVRHPLRVLRFVVTGLALLTTSVSQLAVADPLIQQFLLQELSPAAAGESSTNKPPMAAAAQDPLHEVQKSMVAVKASISNIARTAASFGLERQGNGIIIDANGLIVTAGYVIAEASSLTVTFSDATTVAAEIIAYDESIGLGLIRAQTSIPTTPIKLGDSAKLKVNERALILPALGEGDAKPVQIGKLKQFTGGWEYVLDNAIHTYPPSTSFSGAALLSDKAELLGVGALVTIDIDIDPKVRVPGNIFIPVNTLTGVLGELMVAGRSSESIRPWLGLELKETKRGIVVGAVTNDGPASQSGIKAGDVVVAVDQAKVSGLTQLYRKIWTDFEPGEQIHLLILRDSQYANVPVASVDQQEWLKLEQNRDTAITELTK